MTAISHLARDDHDYKHDADTCRSKASLLAVDNCNTPKLKRDQDNGTSSERYR